MSMKKISLPVSGSDTGQIVDIILLIIYVIRSYMVVYLLYNISIREYSELILIFLSFASSTCLYMRKLKRKN